MLEKFLGKLREVNNFSKIRNTSNRMEKFWKVLRKSNRRDTFQQEIFGNSGSMELARGSPFPCKFLAIRSLNFWPNGKDPTLL